MSCFECTLQCGHQNYSMPDFDNCELPPHQIYSRSTATQRRNPWVEFTKPSFTARGKGCFLYWVWMRDGKLHTKFWRNMRYIKNYQNAGCCFAAFSDNWISTGYIGTFVRFNGWRILPYMLHVSIGFNGLYCTSEFSNKLYTLLHHEPKIQRYILSSFPA